MRHMTVFSFIFTIISIILIVIISYEVKRIDKKVISISDLITDNSAHNSTGITEDSSESIFFGNGITYDNSITKNNKQDVYSIKRDIKLIFEYLGVEKTKPEIKLVKKDCFKFDVSASKKEDDD